MKFVIMYRFPIESMQEWMKKTPEEMATLGKKIDEGMAEWTERNKASIVDMGLPLGKNTRITALEGGGTKVEAISNDLNAYCVVEADTVETVVAMCEDNPHLQFPTAYLDIMAVTHPSAA